MARGGRRSGTPGSAYGQRTDLNGSQGASPSVSPNPRPVYGQGVANQQAEAAVPVPRTVQGTPPSPPPQGASPAVLPGDHGDILGPTAQPDTPLTAGLPTGPGPGPDAIPGMTTTQQNSALLQHLPFLESVIRTDPSTPQEVINLVRYLKGMG